jgi:hypothetical protein
MLPLFVRGKEKQERLIMPLLLETKCPKRSEMSLIASKSPKVNRNISQE